MKAEDRRTCSGCGNEFSGAIEFCPLRPYAKLSLTGLSPGILRLRMLQSS
jgi:hypothetical protein